MGCGGKNRLVVIFLIFTAMSRIHDLPSATPTTSDTIVGTDVSDSNKSVKFTIGDVIGLSVTSLTLNDLSDVNAPDPITTDYYLKYDGSQWVPAAVAGGGGATTLGGLTNVDASADSASTGQVISYDGSTYVPTTPAAVTGATSLNGLDDVNLSVVSDGNFLKYDDGSFINVQPALTDLSGVLINDGGSGTPSNGEVLVYETGNFQNIAPTLNLLSDVATGSLNNGDLLKYNSSSSAWQGDPNYQYITINAAGGYTENIDNGYDQGIVTPGGKAIKAGAFVVPGTLDGWRISAFGAVVFEQNDDSTDKIKVSLALFNSSASTVDDIDATQFIEFSGVTGAAAAPASGSNTAISATVRSGDAIYASILNADLTNPEQFTNLTVVVQLIPPA